MQRNAILVIDDDDMWADRIAWSLRHAFPDMRVQVAFNERDALRRATDLGDDLFLITLDLCLRVVYGHALGVQLRHSFPHALVLPMTSNINANVELAGLGCLPAVIKPVSVTTVVDAVRAARGASTAPLPQEAWVTNGLNQVATFVRANRDAPDAMQTLLTPDRSPLQRVMIPTEKLLAVQRHLQRSYDRSPNRDARQALDLVIHMLQGFS